MKHWQFLIQKQGDRSWQPLESTGRSFVEGKYRIVARSHLMNTPTEVRVSYISSLEIPAKPKFQKRSRSTNAEGLVAVIPFTYLKPGIWKIQCSGDIMSDLLGKSWHYEVELQVLKKHLNKNVDDVNKIISSGSIDVDTDTYEESTGKKSTYQELTTVTTSQEKLTLDDRNQELKVEPKEVELKEAASQKFEGKELVSADFAIDSSSQVSNSSHSRIEKKVEESIREDNVELVNTYDSSVVESVKLNDTVKEHLESPHNNLQKTSLVTMQGDFSLSEQDSVSVEQVNNSEEQLEKELVEEKQIPVVTKVPAKFSESTENLEEKNILEFADDNYELTNTDTDSDSEEVEHKIENLEENLEDISASGARENRGTPDLTSNTADNEEQSSIPDTRVFRNDTSDELTVVPQSTRAITLLELELEEHSIIDAPVNPVWLQDESAEKILQNLVDLALPSSDSLLKGETKNNQYVDVSPSLPLLIILEAQNYIARWGESLSINGLVKFNEANCYDLGEAYNFDSIFAGELFIEFSSPDTLHVLKKFQKSLPEKLLPFEFEFSAVIPAESESKLILAKISLHGVLSGIGEPELLAEQSFTITAELGELLAIASRNPKGVIAQSSYLSSSPSNLTQGDVSSSLIKEASTGGEVSSPESSTNIDLQLFNLVKTAKSSEQFSQPVTNKSPELTNLQQNSVRNFPKSQNPLENLLIRRKVTGSTLPYLKKLSASTLSETTMTPEESSIDLVSSKKAITPRGLHGANAQKTKEISDELDNLDLENLDYPQIQAAAKFGHEESNKEFIINEEQLEESIVDGLIDPIKSPDFSLMQESVELNQEDLSEEIAIANNSTLPTSNPYPSPLIRQWLESQGHSLPPVENLQYESYDTTGKYFPQSENLISTSNLINTQIYENSSVENIDINTEFQDTGNSEELISSESNSSIPIPTSEKSETSNLSAISSSIQPYSESSWLSHEIVVDDVAQDSVEDSQSSSSDTSNFNHNDNDESFLEDKKSSKSSALVIQGSKDLIPVIQPVTIEPLPIPQLYIPNGELVSGKTIRVKVSLEPVSIQVAVKFWVEDTQTRWLLFGPQLLTNLLPNQQGNLETMTQLSIPFGCMKIRLEAIAVDLVTEQESHKVSIIRSVVPPNLPSLQIDRVLGI